MTAQDPKLLVYLKVCWYAAVILGGIAKCLVLTCAADSHVEACCCKTGCLALLQDKLLQSIHDKSLESNSSKRWRMLICNRLQVNSWLLADAGIS